MRTSPIGDVIIELSEIDSTNNYAMRLINEGMAEHGMTIRADYQTAGKGQLGNVWQAELSKNLLCSVILDTKDFSLDKQFYLNAASCLAVAELLMKTHDLNDVHLKWPNDIYAGNKKIAGILIENQIRGSQWTHAVIGIGLNINQQNFDDLNRATSILLENGKKNKVQSVLKNLLKDLQQHMALIVHNESILLERYNQNLWQVGNMISFKKNHEYHEGRILGVNPQGCIEIEIKGKIKAFKHKEIELLLT
jgi:BirA family transcriptional regulator, biotin operon repressor / biotin---[acetyl-CoA-carboxylase] ligase